MQRLRKRRDEQRLGESRHADEQRVAAGEDGDEHFLNDVFLADDDLGELGLDARAGGFEIVHRLEVGIGGAG